LEAGWLFLRGRSYGQQASNSLTRTDVENMVKAAYNHKTIDISSLPEDMQKLRFSQNPVSFGKTSFVED
jgi:hypothetical protein